MQSDPVSVLVFGRLMLGRKQYALETSIKNYTCIMFIIFFLKRGTTFAPFQVAGNIHCVKDILKRKDNSLHRDWALSFNTLLLMKSAPTALF